MCFDLYFQFPIFGEENLITLLINHYFKWKEHSLLSNPVLFVEG